MRAKTGERAEGRVSFQYWASNSRFLRKFSLYLLQSCIPCDICVTCDTLYNSSMPLHLNMVSFSSYFEKWMCEPPVSKLQWRQCNGNALEYGSSLPAAFTELCGLHIMKDKTTWFYLRLT